MSSAVQNVVPSAIDDPVAGVDPSTPALAVSGASKLFGEQRALDAVSLTAHRGEVLGLLGHNGAGKTTLVRLLAGLLRPDEGEVRVLGDDPVEHGVRVRRRLGVLPSSSLLDVRLTARENLLFAGRLFGMDRDDAQERTTTLLADFGVVERADDQVGGFSAGMRQRVALARVLLPRPDVLLLDEPSASLDPVGSRELRQLIRRISKAEGRTVMLCTHDLAEAAELCDEVVILSRGRVLRRGAPGVLVAEASNSTVRIVLDVEDEAAARSVLGSRRQVRSHDGGQGAGATSVTVEGLDPAATADLVTELVGAGVRLHAVVPGGPSLEDLYFAVHDEKEQL